MRYLSQSLDDDYVESPQKTDRRMEGRSVPQQHPSTNHALRAQEAAKQTASPPVPPHGTRDSGYSSTDTVRGLRPPTYQSAQNAAQASAYQQQSQHGRLSQPPSGATTPQRTPHERTFSDSESSDSSLQAELAKDMSWMRLTQNQTPHDADRTPTAVRNAPHSKDFAGHGQQGLTAFPQPQLGKQSSQEIAQEQMRRRLFLEDSLEFVD